MSRYKISGVATKLGKKVDRGRYFKLEIMEGAFDKFLSGDRGNNPMSQDVILTTDHMIQAHTILAREGQDTLVFKLQGKDKLVFNAEIETGENSTSMQRDVASSIKQGNLSQLSVGLIPIKYMWNLEDEDNPVYEVHEASLRELSILPYGAMGEDAELMASDGQGGIVLGVNVDMRLYTGDDTNLTEMTDLSILESLEKAKAEKEQEKLRVKQEADEQISSIMASIEEII